MKIVKAVGLFALGVLTGVAVTSIKPAYGTLKIDRSNPEKDVYRFDIDGDLEKLRTIKTIKLKVDNYADLSQN